ncbi:MAG: antitoxin VapB family protein [Gemmatimonadota bacterium]
MTTKTISLKEEAYERLRRAKRDPSESFSDVVLRARWDDTPITTGGLLRLVRERGPLYSATELDAIEAANRSDLPPTDKWAAD